MRPAWSTATLCTVSLGRAGEVCVENDSQRAAGSSKRRRDTPPLNVPAHSHRVRSASVVTCSDTISPLARPSSALVAIHLPFSNLATPLVVPAHIVRRPSARVVSSTCVTISLGKPDSLPKLVHCPCSNFPSPPSV